jgi:cellulose synthase/poly-beta-1,6-N-acetylglucosamine synthase-like glycosyltransferase
MSVSRKAPTHCRRSRSSSPLDYPAERLTALVVSDGSSDETCRRARDALSERPPHEERRVRVIERSGRSGKTVAISHAAGEAEGEILIFTDANTLYRPDAVRRLVAPFRDPRVGLVSGRLQYEEDPGAGAGGEGLYWRYENAIKRWEGAIGSLLVANGSIYAIRRRLFEPIPGPVADDFVLPLVVAHRGKQALYAPEAIAEEKLPTHAGEDFRSKARIVTQGFEAIRLYRSRILGSGAFRTLQYLLHKVLRWLGGAFALGLLLSSLAGSENPVLLAAGVLQLAFYALAFTGFLLRRRDGAPALVRIPFYFCLVNAAALKGLGDFLVGRDRSVWEKSESTRR